MLAPRFIPLVLRQIIRHRTRSLLTVLGVAVVMFLFCAVQGMQAGVREATQQTAADSTLIVYRQNRFCPSTSRLPEDYMRRISGIPGVRGVIPMKIEVTNCRTALDVVTFRGVPPEVFVKQHGPRLRMIAGTLHEWSMRPDAAIIGRALAQRRGFAVGERFDAIGINVYIAGIIDSPEPQDQNVAYVHLPFLQMAADRQPGIVTQFTVQVDDPARLDEVARRIDDEFAAGPEPTHTSGEKAFVARAAGDIVNIVSYTRWLGWGCIAATLALIGNAIVLSVQDRIREHAVLQTLGYTTGLVARLIIVESALIGLAGGALGTIGTMLLVHYRGLSLSTEGLSIHMVLGADALLWGLALSVLLGVLAGLVPAWQASRREITACFRAV
jgi:putative ABC transport system permease protein